MTVVRTVCMITLDCNGCGSSFEVYPSKSDKKFCSRECWSDSSRVEKTCEFCSEGFWTYKSVDKKYCSDECYREDNSKSFKTVECEFCGSEFEKDIKQIEKYPRHFCNKSCKASSQTGEDSTNWKGGDYIYDLYGPNWSENRELALERDSYSCAICGNDDRRLEVHHITPRRELYIDNLSVFEDGVNDLDNLVTLCVDHHAKLEGELKDCNYEEFLDSAKDLLG